MIKKISSPRINNFRLKLRLLHAKKSPAGDNRGRSEKGLKWPGKVLVYRRRSIHVSEQLGRKLEPPTDLLELRHDRMVGVSIDEETHHLIDDFSGSSHNGGQVSGFLH